MKLCIGLGMNWQLIGVEALHEAFFVAAKRFRSALTLQAGFKSMKIWVVLSLDVAYLSSALGLSKAH